MLLMFLSFVRIFENLFKENFVKESLAEVKNVTFLFFKILERIDNVLNAILIFTLFNFIIFTNTNIPKVYPFVWEILTIKLTFGISYVEQQ
jgi:hypothetical protein